MDYPSHVLPTAAIQIAAISQFKTELTKNVRSFGVVSPLITPKSLPPPVKRVADDPPGESGDTGKKTSGDSGAGPEPFRVSTAAVGFRHSSGGIIIGTCVIRVPVTNNLTAEAHIVSHADIKPHLPFGSTPASFTLNRLISFEDLYTTIFKDGTVRLSLTSEVFVKNVGYFNYCRVYLKDGCVTRLPMVNFVNYLKTTNKACVVMSHLDSVILLFPDTPLATDIGLPKPDPLAQPHFLNSVVLTPLSRMRFYDCFVKVNDQIPRNSGFLESVWKQTPMTTLSMRYLRFSFGQQGDAQRLYLRKQAEKASKMSNGLKKSETFVYKPLSSLQEETRLQKGSEIKSVIKPLMSISPSVTSQSYSTITPSEKSASMSKEKASEVLHIKPTEELEKEEEDDDIDDLAVLDTIDKMVLEDASTKAPDNSVSTKKKGSPKSSEPTSESFTIIEIFHDPPASPNSEKKTEKSEMVPVIEHTSLCPIRKDPLPRSSAEKSSTSNDIQQNEMPSSVSITAPDLTVPAVSKTGKLEPSSTRQSFNLAFMNSVKDLKSIVANIKERIKTQNVPNTTSTDTVSPAKGTPEDNGSGATPTPENTPTKKSEIDTQSIMKSSKDWYWFYMKKQSSKETDGQTETTQTRNEISSTSTSSLTSNSTPILSNESQRSTRVLDSEVDLVPPRRKSILPTPPKRVPMRPESSHSVGTSRSYRTSPSMSHSMQTFDHTVGPSRASSFPSQISDHSDGFERNRRPESGQPGNNWRNGPRRNVSSNVDTTRISDLEHCSHGLDQHVTLLPRTGVSSLLSNKPALLSRPISSPNQYKGPAKRPLLQRAPLLSSGDPSSMSSGTSMYSSNQRMNTVAASSRDVDLREFPSPSFNESVNFSTSKFDVDMRVPSARFSRTSVYEPSERRVSEGDPLRSVKRISTYEPGRGFQ